MFTLCFNDKDIIIDKYYFRDHYYCSNINESIFIHSKKFKKSFKYNPRYNISDISNTHDVVKGQVFDLSDKDSFNEVSIVGFIGQNYILSRSTLLGIYYITENLNFPGMRVAESA